MELKPTCTPLLIAVISTIVLSVTNACLMNTPVVITAKPVTVVLRLCYIVTVLFVALIVTIILSVTFPVCTDASRTSRSTTELSLATTWDTGAKVFRRLLFGKFTIVRTYAF